MFESLSVAIATGKTQSLRAAICAGLQNKCYKILLFILLPKAILTSSVTVDTPTGDAIGSVMNCNNKRMHVFRGIPCVRAPTGDVIGSVVNYNNKRMHVFLGIPYAEPPVGNLRFRKTVPVEPWTSPVIANSLPPACYQYSPYNYSWEDNYPNQSEDCLYLNIWAPEFSNSGEKKAVMFYVFPGSFSYGSNRLPLYDGRVLTTEGDVIVVTINYRLSVLGFFSSGTEDVPGNAGLYDMLEALKWVNKNIAAFGGDRERITVFGDSAGSISAGLLCVSPLSKGLFQRVIMQSGSPAYFLNDNRSPNLQVGQRLAEKMECANQYKTLNEHPHDVIECLRTKDAYELVTATHTLDNYFSSRVFFTVIGDDFLPVDPLNAITQGHFNGVDTIIGNTQDEGSIFLVDTFRQITGPFGELNPQINKTFGERLIRKLLEDFPDLEAVILHYLGDVEEDDYDTIRSQVYHSFGDFIFVCPTKYFAEKVSEKNKEVYRYYFSHRPRVTPWAEWIGVAHFDDVQFAFGRPLDSQYNYTLEEKELSFQMVKEWTNFAKGIKPSNMWQNYTRSNPSIGVFNVVGGRTSNLEAHEENCEFFRPYFGV